MNDAKPEGLVARLGPLLLEVETAKDFLGSMGTRVIGLCWLSGLFQFELEASVRCGKAGVKAGTQWLCKDQASSFAFLYACNTTLKVVNLHPSSVFLKSNSKSKSDGSFDRDRLSI